MKLKLQKRIAADIMKCSEKRVKFDPEKLSEVKEAITKADLKGLIKRGVVKEKPVKGVGRYRARKRKVQKRKGRQQGSGKRKGKVTAREKPKQSWMNRIRAQRKFLSELKSKGIITTQTFGALYRKAKGGFFRSTRHIKIYATEQGMFKKK